MLTIVVCVGSSCHVRGSDEVAGTIERLADKEGLAGRIELIGTFCMDQCSMGVSVRVGDDVFRGVRPDQAEALFYNEIMTRINPPAPDA